MTIQTIKINSYIITSLIVTDTTVPLSSTISTNFTKKKHGIGCITIEFSEKRDLNFATSVLNSGPAWPADVCMAQT